MDVSTTLTDLVFNKPLENTDGKSLKKLIQGKENWKDRTVIGILIKRVRIKPETIKLLSSV
jgi:hypothetical protein